MRKLGKTLVALFIVAELGFVLYIMSPLSDRNSGKSPAGTDATVKAAEADSLSDPGAGQVAGGAIAGNGSASADPSSSSRIVAVPNVLANEAKPHVAASAHTASVPAVVVPRQPVATVVTDAPQLKQAPAVRKPTLARASPATPSPPQQHDSHPDDGRYRGDNSVAAAMTEALVKQSAQLDPSLPPPTNMPVHDAVAANSGAARGGANAVAAAMTAELVRESSKVNTPAQAAGQTGTR
jgi:resuscitation-promoting factor RpfA